MPAVSQAQREATSTPSYGHAWVKEHGFDNKGKLPPHSPQTPRGRMIRKFARKHRG